MLGLAWLAWLWARRAWGDRAGLYAGLAVLTSIGPFLFTRFIIPEAELSLFLLIALYALITGLEDEPPQSLLLDVGRRRAGHPHQGTHRSRLLYRSRRSLSAAHRPMAPLARAQALHRHSALSAHRRAVAHPLRHLQSRPGTRRRQPPHLRQRPRLLLLLLRQRALPALLRPALSARLQQNARPLTGWPTWPGSSRGASFCPPPSSPWPGRPAAAGSQHLHRDAGQTVDFYLDNAVREDVASYVARLKFRVRTIWLLCLFSAWTLLFFSISTNQEYYTFPVWPPLFILIAGVVAGIEENRAPNGAPPKARSLLSTAWLTGAQAAFAVIGVLSAIALGWGLWTSRNLALRSRHRNPAGSSRRGRLHAFHVAPLRPYRRRRSPLCACPPRLPPSRCSSAPLPAGCCA